MKRKLTISRRDALKAAAAVAAPIVLPGHLFGADAPSKKIILACIGIGWQGGGNMIADVTFERTLFQPAPNRFEKVCFVWTAW